MITVKKFYATWCGPCKMLAPVMEQIRAEYSQIDMLAIDVDENYELAASYGVKSVPTVIIEKNGVEILRLAGVHSKMTYANVINENLQK
jgi:thioredoxin 1